MTDREARLAEAVEARKAATTSDEFVRTLARERKLREGFYSESKHARGRGGRWADMLKGKPMEKPKAKTVAPTPTPSEAATPTSPPPLPKEVADAVETGGIAKGKLGNRIVGREVVLRGAITMDDAVQRVSKGLGDAGYVRVKRVPNPPGTEGIAVVHGFPKLMQTPGVVVRLDPVPGGHKATVLSTQWTGGNPLRRSTASAQAAEKAALYIGQMSDVAPGAEPQLEMFKRGE